MKKVLLNGTIICSTLIGPRMSVAHTITVNCLGAADFDRIQDAVDVAGNGDTLLIAPCVYEEQVNIGDKSLALIGGGKQATILGGYHTLLR